MNPSLLARSAALVAVFGTFAAAPADTHFCSWVPHEHAAQSIPPSNFTTLGTKWGQGPNVAQQLNATTAGTAGSATWSIMRSGLGIQGFETHNGGTTLNFGSLIGGATDAEEIATIQSALNVWDAASGFTNLGQVADGGVNGGASQASGGHLGDIRLGLLNTGFNGELAHAYQPFTAAFNPNGGTLGGDQHINDAFNWVDDPTDTNADNDFDLFTVILHELGHGLGLNHTDVANSVMNPFYGGARRSLGADDTAGIVAIYGAAPVPEPATLAALGLGAAALLRRRRRAR